VRERRGSYSGFCCRLYPFICWIIIKEGPGNFSGGRSPHWVNHVNLCLSCIVCLQVESNLIKLEFERNKLLKSQEDLWRIRSRAIWVQSGDQNTKFFHQFANHRRNRKYIWEVCDDSGTIHKGQKAIARRQLIITRVSLSPQIWLNNRSGWSGESVHKDDKRG
jgi:hypothetical protein